MAAATLSTIAVSPLESNRRGNQVTYQAAWKTTFNQAISGPRAEQIARLNLQTPLPLYGAPLNWTFNTDAADNFADDNVFALDFSTKPLFGQSPEASSWMTQVTWRTPDPQNDEEPGQADQPPLSRPTKHWIEYEIEFEETTKGYLYTGGLPGPPDSVERFLAGDGSFPALTTMRNSAGDPFPAYTVQTITPILVAQKNVASLVEGYSRNVTFRKTVNDDELKVNLRTGNNKFTLTIPKYQARFMRTVTGLPVYEEDRVFHRQQTRLELNDEPYKIARLNEGIPTAETRLFNASWTGAARNTVKRNTDGTPTKHVSVALRKDGREATDPSQFNEIEYMLLTPKDYSTFV